MIYSYEIGLIAVVSICTFLTRLFPFVVFGRKGTPSPAVRYLGEVLPGAVIAVLIIYCLKGIDFAVPATFLPNIIAIAVVAVLHIWKRNNLLSIGVGTACYMLLVQLVFKV